MLPDATATPGHGICPNHGLGDLSTRLMPKDCPDCKEYSTVEEHKRCAKCAVNQNKCALCDGSLN